MSHAIVGCGRIAPSHVDALRYLGMPIVTCVDSSEAKAVEFAKRFNIPETNRSFEEVLARADVRSVSLCVPHDLHVKMALSSLQAGKHTLVEKPSMLGAVSENDLVSLAEARGCVLMPVAQHRFDSVVIEIKQMLSSGALGTLRFANVRLECARPPEYYRESTWRGRWDREGGSVLINQGYHLIDLLLLLAGPIVSVTAQMSTTNAEIMDTEDTLVATCRFQSGALGSIAITGAAGSQWKSGIELLGSDGELSFTIDFPNTVPRFRLRDKARHVQWRRRLLEAARPKTPASPTVDYYGLSHRDQVRAFLDSIEGRSSATAANLAEAVRVVRLATQIYKCAGGDSSAPQSRTAQIAAPSKYGGKPSELISNIWNDTWRDLTPDDADALRDLVLRGEISVVSGGVLSRFEQKFATFTGTKFAVALNNGTAAIYAALWAVGVRAGDDVLVCDYGFHGMAAATLSLGARLVVCDCDPTSFVIDPTDIARKITTRTKAILVHNPWGVPAHFDQIRRVAAGIPIVSDASHAHGAYFEQKPISMWADVTCFSLGRMKLVSGGELGGVVTDDVAIRDRVLLYGHVNRVPEALRSLKWEGNAVGIKFRPHPAALTLALSQLSRIEDKLRLSRDTNQRLETLLATFDLLPQDSRRSRRSYWKLVLRIGEAWCGHSTEVIERRLRQEHLPLELNHYWPLLQDQPICNWADYKHLVVRSETPVAHAVTPRTLTFHAPVRLEEVSFTDTARIMSTVASELRIGH